MQPENFNANVLLRPVLQDYLLPTLAYIGGPAEIAYFAQVGVVYEKLLGRVTPILPRMSATLLEPRIERLLTKYGLESARTCSTASANCETAWRRVRCRRS